MFSYEPAYEPRTDYWLEYGKDNFIQRKIEEICEHIVRRGERTHFQDAFDLLYEYIEDNLDKFMKEPFHGYDE